MNHLNGVKSMVRSYRIRNVNMGIFRGMAAELLEIHIKNECW